MTIPLSQGTNGSVNFKTRKCFCTTTWRIEIPRHFADLRPLGRQSIGPPAASNRFSTPSPLLMLLFQGPWWITNPQTLHCHKGNASTLPYMCIVGSTQNGDPCCFVIQKIDDKSRRLQIFIGWWAQELGHRVFLKLETAVWADLWWYPIVLQKPLVCSNTFELIHFEPLYRKMVLYSGITCEQRVIITIGNRQYHEASVFNSLSWIRSINKNQNHQLLNEKWAGPWASVAKKSGSSSWCANKLPGKGCFMASKQRSCKVHSPEHRGKRSNHNPDTSRFEDKYVKKDMYNMWK